MSFRLVFRPQAQDELLSARDWYEEHREGLGDTFVVAVDAAVASILEYPMSYPYVHGEIRRAVLARFPYGVFYRVLDNEVVILGVVHGHRDPRAWKSRG